EYLEQISSEVAASKNNVIYSFFLSNEPLKYVDFFLLRDRNAKIFLLERYSVSSSCAVSGLTEPLSMFRAIW
ncbi:MAG: hypothetical protein ABF533_02875, partial [Acetobacter persici]|uniref:hypothetical protein n=1 Tax=Acetobacter persici TaxID=1076596 RepID=UPI0039E81F04